MVSEKTGTLRPRSHPGAAHARNMGNSDEVIKIRHIVNCHKTDLEYGRGVADALSISYEKAGIQ